MKKLVFIACLLPTLASAQRYEISDVAGYGGLAGQISNPWQYGTVKAGISNLFSLDYHLSNTFSVGALWLVNSWNATGNGFGIAANCHVAGFYAGVEATDLIFTGHAEPERITPVVSYKPALSTGVHIGSCNRIYKFLFLKEQIGMSYSALSFSYYTAFQNGAYEPAWYHEKCTFIYIQLGIALKFGEDPPIKPRPKQEALEDTTEPSY